MASSLSPTAANIISSLGIKGATVNEALPGYVPVLGPDGKLNADFMPANAAQAALPGLSDAAFVDPHTTVGFEDGVDIDTGHTIRKGSIVAPYQNLKEAVEHFRPSSYAQGVREVAFILAPGTYDGDKNSDLSFDWSPDKVYLIGLGACRMMSGMVISGMRSSPLQEVVLQNITMDYSGSCDLTVLGTPAVSCLGRTYIEGYVCSGSDGNGPTNVRSLTLSADSYVSSPYASSISYLANASKIDFTHGSDWPDNVRTVKAALDHLGSRKIRVSTISGSGADIGESSYVDISAESGVYDLSGRDAALVSAIRELYGKLSDIDAETISAETITARETLNAKTISIDALSLGGHKLEIDAYGYLVVSDGSAPHGAADGSYILQDRTDGSLWLVGVHDGGRLFIERYYEDDSSGSDDYPDQMDFLDSGDRYVVTMENGRLVITKDES